MKIITDCGGKCGLNPGCENLPVFILRKVYRAYSLTTLSIILLLSVAQASFAISPSLAAIETTNVGYTEGQAATLITGTITVTDSDSPTLVGAIIQISANYSSTEDLLKFTNAFGITGIYDVASGTLTLSGSATLANYRSAVRSITFQNTNNDNPSNLIRTISFSVNDGTTNSNTVTRNISVLPVNDIPVISNIEVPALAYTEEDLPAVISSTLTVLDVDNITLAGATIQITTRETVFR